MFFCLATTGRRAYVPPQWRCPGMLARPTRPRPPLSSRRLRAREISVNPAAWGPDREEGVHLSGWNHGFSARGAGRPFPVTPAQSGFIKGHIHGALDQEHRAACPRNSRGRVGAPQGTIPTADPSRAWASSCVGLRARGRQQHAGSRNRWCRQGNAGQGHTQRRSVQAQHLRTQEGSKHTSLSPTLT